MKKMEMRDKEYFGIKKLKKKEKSVLTFLKKIDLEKMVFYKTITTYEKTKTGKKYSTEFQFKSEDNKLIQFSYYKNKKIEGIYVWERGTIFEAIEDKKKYKLISFFWNQFVNHFNLRIRLMFINETTPWKWKTEFAY